MGAHDPALFSQETNGLISSDTNTFDNAEHTGPGMVQSQSNWDSGGATGWVKRSALVSQMIQRTIIDFTYVPKQFSVDGKEVHYLDAGSLHSVQRSICYTLIESPACFKIDRNMVTFGTERKRKLRDANVCGDPSHDHLVSPGRLHRSSEISIIPSIHFTRSFNDLYVWVQLQYFPGQRTIWTRLNTSGLLLS